MARRPTISVTERRFPRSPNNGGTYSGGAKGPVAATGSFCQARPGAVARPVRVARGARLARLLMRPGAVSWRHRTDHAATTRWARQKRKTNEATVPLRVIRCFRCRAAGADRRSGAGAGAGFAKARQRRHRVDADLGGAGADDDGAGPGAVLRRHGPQDERAGDGHAELCRDLPRHRCCGRSWATALLSPRVRRFSAG